MSLPALEFKYVGQEAFGSATPAEILNAIYNLGTRVVYQDTTTRTPGSGSAGTYSRYQFASITQAVYLTPAVDTLNHRIIFAGAVPNTTFPVMLSPHGFSYNVLMGGIAKNAGAYASWNGVNPFTSGQFSGYVPLWATSAGTGSVFLWESKETVMIAVSSGTSMYLFTAGAIMDSFTTGVSANQESDDRIYGLASTGSIGVSNTTGHSAVDGGDGVFFSDRGISSGSSFGMFVPGTGTWRTLKRFTLPATAVTATNLVLPGGEFARLPIYVANKVSGQINGALRGIQIMSDQVNGAQLEISPGVKAGYIVGTSAASADAWLLEA